MRVLLTWATAALLVCGCGGGGGGGGSSDSSSGVPAASNVLPTVNAGMDQTVFASTVVQLLATANDPDGTIQSTSWNQISGPTVVLGDPSSLVTQFVAPAASVATNIILEIEVTDNSGGSSTDTVLIQIVPSGSPPLASAGTDQTVLKGSTVTLDGSASSDPDGDPLEYEWVILSAPIASSAALSATNVEMPTLVPDAVGRYELQLLVRDATKESVPDQVTVIAANELGGVIAGDLTLTAADSPYLMTQDLQIPFGSSVNIPAGVEVIGAGYSIRVGGTLTAQGTDGQLVQFDDVHIEPATGPVNELFSINLSFVHIVGGSIYRPTGFAIYGGLSLTDSRIEDTESYLYLWYPVTGSQILRNVFIRTGGISTGLTSVAVIIQNNVFLEQTTGFAVLNWQSNSSFRTIVSLNSFLSTDRTALFLRPGFSGGFLDGANNYWGTTDTTVIDQMIFDANDDINSAATINYLPILTAPDVMTPSPITGTNISPVVNAGADQTVNGGTVVNLIGSATDLDGTIQSVMWRQINGSIISLDDAASLVTQFSAPSVSSLTEIILELTATDNVGAQTSDTVTIRVLPPGTNTLLGGVITGDLTLAAADSPYLMTQDLQIPFGSSVNIPAGVEVIGAGYSIRVGGTLTAQGTAGQLVQFSDVHIEPATGPVNELFSIDLSHVHIVRGSVYRPTGFEIYGGLSLTDSRIEDTESYLYLWYPVTESQILRNVFIRTGGISTGLTSVAVIIQNNVFLEQTTDFAVQNWQSNSSFRTIVSLNSFLSTDRTALLLRPGFSGGFLDGANNYWGTTDTTVIDQMIFDANDDINSAAMINYLPILTAPDVMTPIP